MSKKRKKLNREFSPKVRKQIHERAEGTCEVMLPGICRGMQGLQCHHRQNRSQGGMGTIGNGLLVCLWCHEWIGMHPARSYSMGLLVKSTGIPEETPVLRRGKPTILTDAGEIELLTASHPSGAFFMEEGI